VIAIRLWLALGALGTSLQAAPGAAPKLEQSVAAVRPLRWTGTAHVQAGEQSLAIGVSTHVVPFRSARSDNWLLSEGTGSKRAMIIEPSGGWIERSGKREPMPEAMLRHERQQFAIYGLMQMALADKLSHVRGSPERDIPDTRFTFDGSGRLIEARNQVDPPTAGGKIQQLFRFSGEVRSRGLKWPKRIEIFQEGRPYFTLEIDSFAVEGR
jgi:hypothetical protein